MKKVTNNMKVVLLKDVKGTGQRGEVKDVSTGFVRNFLLPKGLVRVATAEVVASLQKSEVKKKKKSVQELKGSQEDAGKVDGLEIELFEKTSSEGKLYAAVGGAKVGKEIKKATGVMLATKQIILKKPIKEVGDYVIKIEFGHGIEAEVKVTISES